MRSFRHFEKILEVLRISVIFSGISRVICNILIFWEFSGV
jgi:hypothetical protein